MLEITVSQNDANYGRVVDGKWYQAECKSVATVDKKGGKVGQNYLIISSLIGPDDTNGPVTGLEVQSYVPTDKPQYLMPIIKAVNKGAQPKVGEKINLDAIPGQKYDIFVKPQQSDGSDRIFNSIEDYAPLGSRTGGQ
jgi:hypothetical protein